MRRTFPWTCRSRQCMSSIGSAGRPLASRHIPRLYEWRGGHFARELARASDGLRRGGVTKSFHTRTLDGDDTRRRQDRDLRLPLPPRPPPPLPPPPSLPRVDGVCAIRSPLLPPPPPPSSPPPPPPEVRGRRLRKRNAPSRSIAARVGDGRARRRKRKAPSRSVMTTIVCDCFLLIKLKFFSCQRVKTVLHK